MGVTRGPAVWPCSLFLYPSALPLSTWVFKSFPWTPNNGSRTSCCNECRNVRWAVTRSAVFNTAPSTGPWPDLTLAQLCPSLSPSECGPCHQPTPVTVSPQQSASLSFLTPRVGEARLCIQHAVSARSQMMYVELKHLP